MSPADAVPAVLAEAIADLTRRVLEMARRGEAGSVRVAVDLGPVAPGARVDGPHGQDRRTYRIWGQSRG